MNSKHTIIIAEAGVNHNGSMSLAKDLIDVAKRSGCDYVKFQTFKAKKLASPTAKKAKYQSDNDSRHDTQFKMLKELELSEQDHFELMNYCKEKDIKFLSTPFDEESAEFLMPFVDLFKIPSGELTNLPYIEYVAKLGKPIVLSTGMATIPEIKEAIEVIKLSWAPLNLDLDKNLKVLHCTTAYPTDFSDVNLLAMDLMREELGVPIGYSDHTLGIGVPVAAVARGAVLIEKHFTLSRDMVGPDHKASLEPIELIEMVKTIRVVEKCIGVKKKSPTDEEEKNKVIARKSLHFSRDLNKGHILSHKDLMAIRPEGGLHPRELKSLIGKTLNVEVKAYQETEEKHFN